MQWEVTRWPINACPWEAVTRGVVYAVVFDEGRGTISDQRLASPRSRSRGPWRADEQRRGEPGAGELGGIE